MSSTLIKFLNEYISSRNLLSLKFKLFIEESQTDKYRNGKKFSLNYSFRYV